MDLADYFLFMTFDLSLHDKGRLKLRFDSHPSFSKNAHPENKK